MYESDVSSYCICETNVTREYAQKHENKCTDCGKSLIVNEELLDRVLAEKRFKSRELQSNPAYESLASIAGDIRKTSEIIRRHSISADDRSGVFGVKQENKGLYLTNEDKDVVLPRVNVRSKSSVGDERTKLATELEEKVLWRQEQDRNWLEEQKEQLEHKEQIRIQAELEEQKLQFEHCLTQIRIQAELEDQKLQFDHEEQVRIQAELDEQERRQTEQEELERAQTEVNMEQAIRDLKELNTMGLRPGNYK